jgi:excinuclease ABC subunit C
VLELDSGLEFNPASDAEFFSLLPAKPGVCLISAHQTNAEPYLIRTADLRRRLQRLLGPPDPATKRLNLREFAREVRYRQTASAFEQTLTYYQQARQFFPTRYRDMMRVRPAAVLKVSLRNAYPRCFVTRHISVDERGSPNAGAFYGPFASRRSADAFAEKFLDLFKVRRCQIKIRRDPTFPGCLYSEMKMCLAPCFAGCSKEEYDVEVSRLVSFLDTSGNSLRAAFEQERERASEDLDFEKAASVHKKIEKLDEVLRGRSELARRIQDLDAVILQRGGDKKTIGLFALRGGKIAEPFFLRFEATSQPASAEETVRDYLEGISNQELPRVKNSRQAGRELGEHLWLVARWFHSNPRDGEIFFRDKDWPYRRILRGCTRLLSPKKETPEQTGVTGANSNSEERK